MYCLVVCSLTNYQGNKQAWFHILLCLSGQLVVLCKIVFLWMENNPRWFCLLILWDFSKTISLTQTRKTLLSFLFETHDMVNTTIYITISGIVITQKLSKILLLTFWETTHWHSTFYQINGKLSIFFACEEISLTNQENLV